MTASVVFTLFYLHVWEGHNRRLTYLKQQLLSLFLIDLLLLFHQQNKILKQQQSCGFRDADNKLQMSA